MKKIKFLLPVFAVLLLVSDVPAQSPLKNPATTLWKGLRAMSAVSKTRKANYNSARPSVSAAASVRAQQIHANIPHKKVTNLAAGSAGPVRPFASQSSPKSWWDDLDPKSKNIVDKAVKSGIDPAKIAEAFKTTPNKAELLGKLENAKSVYHQRVLVKDWDNIPGVSKSKYQDNGLKAGMSHKAWGKDYDLPASHAANFTSAKAVELPAGTKIYRVTDADYKKNGAYWTLEAPKSVGDVIGKVAVRPEWNGLNNTYDYVVPKGTNLKGWVGSASAQRIADGVDDPHLPGGGVQLYIPDKERNDAFKENVKQTKLPWQNPNPQ
jgi:hypothetical protein